MSGQLLKLSADTLQEMYKEHITTIRAGLLLAICGRVKLTGEGQWQVKGQEAHGGKTYAYTVSILSVYTDSYWTCDCQNFKNATPQNIDFMDSHAKHLCKHIAAVAICRGAAIKGLYPEPETNIYDTISNIVATQHLPAPGQAWLIPGSPVKLARVDLSGRDVVVLQTRRTRSAPLITWVSNPALPGRGMWHLKHDSFEIYCDFVEKAFGVTVKRQEL